MAAITSLTVASSSIFAADHAEAPLVESDQAADIAVVYAFLDPDDNSKVILAFDVHGFIVPRFFERPSLEWLRARDFES